ncbi:MAG: hypothetical protein IT422_00655, partial [Pirellulaceae bacterium]|nr:hypothetical protein [Pirellulaceae bacterium]
MGFESLELRRLLASVPVYMDDSSPSFQLTGNWNTNGQDGYAGTNSCSIAPVTGTNSATWSFDIEPGIYRVATTWQPNGSVCGGNVLLNLYDGTEVIATTHIDQFFYPNDFVERNTSWENLGVFTVQNSLKIVLTDNVNGKAIADAFRVERVEDLPYSAIVDNASSNFSTTGNWINYTLQGYAGSIVYSDGPYNGGGTATWSFDVLPGLYRIAATWHFGYYTYGTNVPLTVLDGNTTIGSAFLNQTLSPSDFNDQGAWWEDIGVFVVGSSLKVRMTNNANGTPIADAFRVERVEDLPYSAIVDNASSNFSTTGNWINYTLQGYAGSIVYSDGPYNGGGTATWSFDVLPGLYRIAATWHFGYYTYGTNVPLAVLDGNTTIGSAILNQTLSPSDFKNQGAWWEDIGVFVVGSSLKVRMTNNANGTPIADAIRVERVGNLPYSAIVDNASSNFSTTGGWSNHSPAGYAGSISFPAAPYNGGDTASWSFDISPGTYRIAATWHEGYSTYGSNVPINIYDGGKYVGSARLNQTISPNDFISQDTWWENIGVFTIWDSLRIDMYDNADGIPIADAFRVERISSDAVPIAGDDLDYYTNASTDLIVSSTGTNHLLKNDVAHDGLIESATVQTQPTHGTLLDFDGQGGFIYRPATGFIGVDTFSYLVQSRNSEASSATVAIAVGTPLLPRKNLDANVLNATLPDAWHQTTLLEPANASAGLGVGYANVPNGSSMDTDGALAATGGLLLMEDVAQDTSLVYRSNSLVKPIIAVDTQLVPGASLPSFIAAKLTLNGVAGTTRLFPTSGLSVGQPLRIALQADGSSLPTGIYPYTVDITLNVNGVPKTTSFTGLQAIVNRSASEFGSGWGLDGLDRLYSQSTGALVVRGNGDSYWFPLSAGVYSHAAGDSSFSRLEKLANNTFALTSKYGIVSNFSTTGLLISRVDSNNNTTSYAYTDEDSDGLVDELLSMTDPFGRVITFGYTGSKVTSITHFSGKITALAYTANNLTSYTLTDPDPNDSVLAPQVSFAYLTDSLGRTDAVNQATTYNFSPIDGRLRSVDFPDATSWEIVPSEVIGLATAASGNLLATPAEAVAKVTDQHEIATVANASERKTWQFRTDRFGGIIQSTTALGFIREYQRDKDGLVHAFIEPDPDGPNKPLVSPRTYIGYNSSGDATYYQAADGGISHTTYSLDLHRPIRTKDPLGNTQSLIYDSRGNLVASVDGAGFITWMIVDSRGLVTRITDPDPDGTGPLAARVTNFAYNSYGMLSTLTNPDNSTQTFSYSSAGQLLTNVDELGKTTTLTYDPLGRPKTQTNRVGAVTQWQYDSASYLRQEIDPVGNITDITYDPLGRTDTITFPDPDGVGSLTRPVNNIEYDPNGNVSFEGDS